MRKPLLLLFPLALAACSHPSSAPSSSGVAPASNQPSSHPSPSGVASAPPPAMGLPDSAYVMLDKPVNVLFLDKALAPNDSKPSFEDMAKASSPQYRAADEATQKNLLAEQAQLFGAAVTEAKNHRNVAWTISRIGWGHYDASQHGYAMQGDFFQPGLQGREAFISSEGMTLAAIRPAKPYNGLLVVSDPAQVATIDQLLAKETPILKAYGEAQSGDNMGDPTVVVSVIKIQVLDHAGQVVATLTPQP